MMAQFDIAGAKSAGYSDQEIADHLASMNKFDAADARKSGYSDAEIISHFAGGADAAPNQPSAPVPEQSFMDELAHPDPNAKYGLVFPTKWTPQKGGEFGHPSTVMQDAYRAVMAPGRAAKGELTPEQMNDEARNMAGMITLARTGAPAMSGLRQAAAEAASAASPIISNAAGAAAKSMERFPTASLAAATPGMQDLTPEASKAFEKLYARLVQEGWTPERMTAKLRQLGPGATFADLEPFAGMQEAVAQVAGKPASTAARALSVRDKRAGSALAQSVSNNISDQNPYETIDALRASRAAVSQPLRQTALAQPRIVKDELVDRLMTTPEMQEGLRRGAAIVRLESARTGEKIPTSETWFHGANFDDPEIVSKTTPTLRMLDAAKQGFDSMLKPFENKYTGKLENLGPYEVELDKTRRALVSVLRDHSDDYAKYLDEWQTPSRLMSAVNKGKQVLQNDPEVTAKAIQGMTPDEKSHFQIGLSRALLDKIADNPQSAIRYFDKGATEAKMRAAFPSSQAYNAFKMDVLRQARFHRTYVEARANSPSVRRALGVADLADDPSRLAQVGGVALDIGTGNNMGLARRAITAVGNRLNRPSQDVANELAPVLYSSDPAIQARVTARLKARVGMK